MDALALGEAGLTDGEARVYLALLELGPSTVGPVIEKSKISHSIVYRILAGLMEKGLVAHISREGVRQYSAANPEKIVEYVEERQKKLEESRKKLQEMVPALQNMASAKESEVRVFVGFRGMVAVHERTYQKLKRGDMFYYMGILPEQQEHFHAYWKRDHMRRARAGIISHSLFSRKTDPKILKNRNSYAYSDARYMPEGLDTPAWFMGYKDVAVIGMQTREPITIEIINQEIAGSFRKYFDHFWEQSKPFKKNKKK